jgi:hypothetical protein
VKPFSVASPGSLLPMLPRTIIRTAPAPLAKRLARTAVGGDSAEAPITEVVLTPIDA